MNAAALSFRQSRFEFRSNLRNRTAMTFTFFFPIMFLLIFGFLFTSGNQNQNFQGHLIKAIQFYVPGIIAYGIIGTCYTGFAIRLANQREQGILKRLAGTPMPKASYVVAQILSSVLMSLLISTLTLVIGVLVFGVHVYAETFPALLTTVIVGSATFCALGIAIAGVLPNADAAPGFINVTVLPVMFISDVFYSVADAPKWLGTVANILPVRHLANALQVTFDPRTTGPGFSAKHLLILAIWGLGAAVFAARRFKWDVSTK